MKRAFLFFLLCLLSVVRPSAAGPGHKTENVIIVVWDGFRWQEFFGGADENLIKTKAMGGIEDPEPTRSRYGRASAEERRAALLPFVWGTIAKKGQIFGDASKKAPAQVTNGMKFSYPGYNEMFCGFGDPRIDSNDKKPNPNMSVLEFLNGRPAYKGKAAVIATWDVFPSIFRVPQSGLPVFAGWTHIEGKSLGEHERRVNEMVDNLPHYWPDNTFDLLTMEATRDYLPKHKPRVLFVGLGETDEWGHARRYDLYLDAARNSDRFVEELWNTVQQTPQYKDKTSIIILCDHGRGATPADWTDHGKKVPTAEFIWIAVLGPDTPAKGVRENVAVTQSQVAATIAGLLGEDFNAAVPQAAKPLPDVGVPTK